MPRVPRHLFVPALLSAALSAQSDAKVVDDAEFLRGVVGQLGFVDYARQELASLKRRKLTASEFRHVARLDPELALQGARRLRDRTRRQRLYREAVRGLSSFFERYGAVDGVQQELAAACLEFAQFLNEERSLTQKEAADGGGLRREAVAVIEKGVAAAQAAEAQLAQAGKKIEALVVKLTRGMLVRARAAAEPENRKYLVGVASDLLEEVVLDGDEGTLLGQKAFLELARVTEVGGDLQAAVAAYRDVSASIRDTLTDPEFEADDGVYRKMLETLQQALARRAHASLARGALVEAKAAVAEFHSLVRKLGGGESPRFRAMIDLAAAKIELRQGGKAVVERSLQALTELLARPIDAVQRYEARSLVDAILRERSADVGPALLVAVADHDYRMGAYQRAIRGYLSALDGRGAASDWDDDRSLHAWDRVGSCNKSLQRPLEATLAYLRGLEAARRANLDRRQVVARRMVSCYGKVADGAQGAGDLKQRVDRQVALCLPDTQGARAYRAGRKARAKRDFARAAERFAEVDASYPRYELARAHRIQCLMLSGQAAQAGRAIAGLRKWVTEHPLEESDQERIDCRKQALAWAHFAEGERLYEAAREQKDPRAFRGVAEHFAQFEQLHAEYSPSHEKALHDILGHAFVALGEQGAAAERLKRLEALSPRNPDAIRNLGLRIFRVRISGLAARETELRAARAERREPAARRLKQARESALELGRRLAALPRPTFGVLYNSMRVAERLEAWPVCSELGERILAEHKAGQQRKSYRQVPAVLARAYLLQDRMNEALDVLDAAEKRLGGEQNSSAYFELLGRRGQALGGWPAFDKDGINYQPRRGLGKPEAAYKIYMSRKYRRFALHSKRAPRYSLPWYRYHLAAYYFAMSARKVDKKFVAHAAALFRIAKSTDDFDALRALGPDGERVYNLFRAIR